MTATPIERLRRSASSLLAAVVLFVGMPALLAAVGRWRFGTSNPLTGIRPPWQWSRDDVESTLRRPLEDHTVADLVVRASLIIAWLALAVIVATVVLEVAHLVRHRDAPPPRRPGLGWIQPLARSIAVGLVALLPVSTRSPVLAVPAPGGVLDATRPALDAVLVEAGPSRPLADPPEVSHAASPLPAADERVHVVERGDSVWSIAAAIGDGGDASTMAIAEVILDRNLGSTMVDGAEFNNPALIRPGWELIVPVGSGREAASRPSATADRVGSATVTETAHVVMAGETLSEIAAEHLGDAASWPDLADANLGRTMPDGRIFDDPDLILPGWTIGVPDGLDLADTGPTESAEPEPDDDTTTPIDPVGSEPHESAPPEPSVIELHDWFDDRPDPSPTTPERDDDGSDPTMVTPPRVTIAPDAPDAPATTTTSTLPSPAGEPPSRPADPLRTPGEGSAPLGIEHAAMLAGGVLALAAIRRRRRLRAARPHARVPEPPDSVEATVRTLRSLGGAERAARLDVAIRALVAQLLDTGARPGAVVHALDGTIEVALTAPAAVAAPWVGSGTRWELPSSVPIELMAEDARRIAMPCPTLIGVGRAGTSEVHVDLEAAGSLVIDGPGEHVDAIINAVAATLATSVSAETTHLVAVGVEATFGHPNAVVADDAATAFRVALGAAGSLVDHERGSLELRARRTGGEAWEPAVVVVSTEGAAGEGVPFDELPDPGRGLAVVVPGPVDHPAVGVRLVASAPGWSLNGFGWEVEIDPIGLAPDDLARIDAVLDHAERLEEPVEVESSSAPATDLGADGGRPADPERVEVDVDAVVPDHAIVVSTLGGVEITSIDGTTRSWQRSKTVELVAWLVTHRHRSTRSAARTAMWAESVRDATFANVVSEARRGLARLVEPATGEEWIPRTLTEELLLHRLVVSDLDLLRARLEAARLAAPAEAVVILRPGLAHVTGLPFADTSYLWPDADGIVTDAILLATTFCTELAEHALSLGDVETVFEATSHGLSVLPGHDDLVALRMRAHARGGDLASVRAEWESYERVVMADAWSDGEPSPRLVELRRQLLA